MRTSLLLLTSLLVACAATPPTPATTPPTSHSSDGLRIRLVTIYVDDQDKALRFYTDVLGFTKKDDVSNGGYRWLTVSDGTSELQLARDDAPAGKAYQQALLQQGQPAVMFYTDDIRREVARIQGAGAELTMPPTDVTMSTIAMLKDGCGNLVQITQLKR